MKELFSSLPETEYKRMVSKKLNVVCKDGHNRLFDHTQDVGGGNSK